MYRKFDEIDEKSLKLKRSQNLKKLKKTYKNRKKMKMDENRMKSIKLKEIQMVKVVRKINFSVSRLIEISLVA